ncbi:MAG: arsenate reductase (glutaredoxin) [Flavobacterium sp.]|nr:arsenate reductase (glutaredoxin) [Flavobacterium sp.]
MIQVYHNPRCTKSRECLAFLENSGKKFEIIKYLEEVPTKKELLSILKKLKMQPIELVRKNEAVWKENFKNKNLSDDEIITAMLQFPILIERPIVINGDKAAVARPIENAIAII